MDERVTQPDCLDPQPTYVVATQGEQTLSALRVESDPLPDAVLSPDETQWWDGSMWRYIHADEPRVQPKAASGPDCSQRPDNAERQASIGVQSASVAASGPTEYPVVLHWKLGSLTATPIGVAFDMTARSVLFGRHKRNIHRDFAYTDLREVEVHPGRASIGVVLRTREDEIQGCQGCTNADEVDAFVAVLVQHDVEVLVGSTTGSVMIGRYSG
jgi:hypothetical protein